MQLLVLLTVLATACKRGLTVKSLLAIQILGPNFETTS